MRTDLLCTEARLATACSDDRTPGLTERLAGVRNEFTEKLVISDVGAIPEKEVWKEDVPCEILHPGLCIRRLELQPAVLQAQSSLHDKLRSFRVGIGNMFAVEVTWPGTAAGSSSSSSHAASSKRDLSVVPDRLVFRR